MDTAQDYFFNRVAARAAAKLAIVGMTKNVGKTVTLNYLISRYAAAGRVLGLLSAGYDGERFDRLTLKDKPRIHAPAGTLIATAEACFEAAGAVLEVVHRSRISTPLGEVWVGRVREAGLVELAGPGSNSGLNELTNRMKELGAEQILVDGAINRFSSASPAVSTGVILASGAAVAPFLDDVIRRTLFRCVLLQTPALEDSLVEEKARQALNRGDAAMLHRIGRTCELELLRAQIPLVAGTGLKERCRKDTIAVVLGGALVDSLLFDMLELPSPPQFIVRDATKIFASPELYYRYLNRGGAIRVLQEINLIAVTLNPSDPLGKGYPPREFLRQVAEALTPLPVFDLVLNEESQVRSEI